jgi:hypothetical protein
MPAQTRSFRSPRHSIHTKVLLGAGAFVLLGSSVSAQTPLRTSAGDQIATWCQQRVDRPEDATRLVQQLAALTGPASVLGIQLLELPRDANAQTLGGANWVGQGDFAQLYWGRGVTGDVIAHELTHLAQAHLSGPALRVELAHVADADETGSLTPYAIQGATSSMLISISRLVDGPDGKDFASEFGRRFRQRSTSARGELQAREAMLIRELQRAQYARVRQEILEEGAISAKGRMVAAGLEWTWQDEIRALYRNEAMAYSVAETCQRGIRSGFLIATLN